MTMEKLLEDRQGAQAGALGTDSGRGRRQLTYVGERRIVPRNLPNSALRCFPATNYPVVQLGQP
jgi:hypothetical protein